MKNNKCIGSSCRSLPNLKIYSFSLGKNQYIRDTLGLTFEDMTFITKCYINRHKNKHEISEKIEVLKKNTNLCFNCKTGLLIDIINNDISNNYISYFNQLYYKIKKVFMIPLTGRKQRLET